jgi:hypothetical protein
VNLNPNCSEYVVRITITDEEKKFVLDFVKRYGLFGFGNPDIPITALDDELVEAMNDTEDAESSFISSGCADEYRFIKRLVQAKRFNASEEFMKGMVYGHEEKHERDD